MFINKTHDNRTNLCGPKITELRKAANLSQRQLADKLTLQGLILDKNAIQRIEAGKRFVTDIELVHFATFFKIDVNQLLYHDDK